jgi:rubrerythrin
VNLADALVRWRHRYAWSDPARKLRTLESFAETEEDGGRDLETAARRASDPELRQHLQRHAADELRHAALFRRHAAELRSRSAHAARDAREADQAYDLSRGRRGHEVDAHGFFRAGLCDELGDVAYVAMLHVAERRAERLFEVHRRLNADDAALQAVFAEILRDEKYHVAYTQRFLERWRQAGRAQEVAEGLRCARASRLLGAWRRLGVRSAAGFAHALLFVLYWTLLLPFGLLARSARPGPAARVPSDEDPARSLSSQA